MEQAPKVTPDKLISLVQDKGKKVYSAHKRIIVPKNILSLDKLKRLGFDESRVAVPEPGQSSLLTYRGPKGLHAHSHEKDKSWVIHQDKHKPELGKFVKHWLTEGLPATADFMYWKVRGKPGIASSLRKQEAVVSQQDIKKVAGCACAIMKSKAGKKLTKEELALIKRNLLKGGLSKKADAIKQGEEKKKELHPAVLPLAVTGATAAGVMTKLRGTRAVIRRWARGRKTGKELARTTELHEVTQDYYKNLAKRVAKKIRRSGVNPAKARIAVGGIGGSGKSTFSRYLAKELKIPYTDMDPLIKSDKSVRGRYYLRGKNLSKYIAENPIPKGAIYEQQHILTKVSPKEFDVAIMVDPKIKDIKSRVLKRERAAYQHDFYKYKPLRKTQRYALKSLGGKNLGKVDDVRVRVSTSNKPFSEKKRKKDLKRLGYKPKELDREQKVWTASTGRKPESLAERTHPILAPFGGGTAKEFLDIPKIWGVSTLPLAAGGATAAVQHQYRKAKRRQERGAK